ncbi:MAG: hypothetical protein K2Y27_27480 [Xanthobacteraceae bacterium]|nr:hypothetical protein [Xanthobacteraceae bacterium]
MSELLKEREYIELPTTKRLIGRCRSDVVAARIRLASDRSLTSEHRVALWTLIDSREWFLKMVAKDYAAELERIDRELEIELSR